MFVSPDEALRLFLPPERLYLREMFLWLDENCPTPENKLDRYFAESVACSYRSVRAAGLCEGDVLAGKVLHHQLYRVRTLRTAGVVE